MNERTKEEQEEGNIIKKEMIRYDTVVLFMTDQLTDSPTK